MLKYQKLFTPLVIGGAVFRNRIFASPTGYMDFQRDGTTPTEETLAYYVRKAQGGAAAVCVGECHIHPPASRAGGLGVDITDDAAMRFMGRLADRVRRLGAVPSMEIQHGGLAADARLGPSDVYVGGDPDIPRTIMNEATIKRTIELFAEAAWRAKHYGFGMVTVHGGHGWLLGQFFSPATNKREDAWGGSAENRARLAVEVCDAIHERCGAAFPVEMRISVTEFEDGYDVDEGVEYAKQLDGHADIIHCSAGLHGHTKRGNSLRWAPSMYDGESPFEKYAEAVKGAVARSLVSTVGGHSSPKRMEEILAAGHADIISVARALNCDPDLPDKARAGLDDEIRECIRCYGCSDALFPTFRIICALTPESGRETEYANVHHKPDPKRVLVAGGGIGGLEAAITCARQGHAVTLCEKSGRLGGAVLCEEAVPFKHALARYLRQQIAKAQELGVDVRLGCEVTPEYIEQEAPDAVIASLGSEYKEPPLKYVSRARLFTLEEAFTDPGRLGDEVAIIGGGPSGAELAVYLHMLGKKPVLIESSPTMPGPQVQGIVTRIELEDRGVKLRFGCTADYVTEDGVMCLGKYREPVAVPSDCTVIATGAAPRLEETFALSAVSPVFYIVGDCANHAGGLGIKNAVESAHAAAMSIGRRYTV